MRNSFNEFIVGCRLYFQRDILGSQDSAHKVALGVAIGVFVALTPTMPFQMMLTVVISWAFGANKLVGMPVVWLTNPATIIPVYLPQYLLGCWLMGRDPKNISWEELTEFDGGFFDYGAQVYHFVAKIFWPLWTGSLIVSSICGLAGYFLVRRLIIQYRKSRSDKV